jgi:predicted dehydrogenase
MDYNQQPPSHHLEIIGSEGTLCWDNADGLLNLYRIATKEWQTFSPPDGFERNQMFLDETRHFLAVMRGETEPICTLEDGKHSLELSLSTLYSAQEGVLISFHKDKL